jgi:AraC-like DNA-binding protein
LSGLEAVAGISVRSLQIEFKKRFQLSPLCWLREQRLLRAHQLLHTDRDNRPVSTIAKECGFTHFGRFSVAFKKKFGVSASELKKSSFLTALEN